MPSDTTRQIRVMVQGTPGLLRDIVCDVLREQADMHVLTEPRFQRPRSHRLPNPPDVVVAFTAGDDELQRASELLCRWPLASILLMNTSANRSALYEFRLHPTVLGELSPEGVISAVRRAWLAARE